MYSNKTLNEMTKRHYEMIVIENKEPGDPEFDTLTMELQGYISDNLNQILSNITVLDNIPVVLTFLSNHIDTTKVDVYVKLVNTIVWLFNNTDDISEHEMGTLTEILYSLKELVDDSLTVISLNNNIGGK